MSLDICLKAGCKFEHPKSIFKFQNIQDLYVCPIHQTMHLCRTHMDFRTCYSMLDDNMVCPISGIQVFTSSSPILNKPKVYFTPPWQSFSEHSFETSLVEYIETKKLISPPNVQKSIIKRLYVLFLAYYRADVSKPQHNEDIIYTKCVQRMCIIKDLLFEHLAPHQHTTSSTGKIQRNFAKHASRFISHDLCVEEELLQPIILRSAIFKHTARKKIFMNHKVNSKYWREKNVSTFSQ